MIFVLRYNNISLSWYYTGFTLLWNKSGNRPQPKFHFDYYPPTTDGKSPKPRITKRSPVRDVTDQGSSLLIALDPFALDCVLNDVIKRIEVVEGAAIAFSNKLWHRGAANLGPAGWRLFMYSSPDPLPYDKIVHLPRKDSTDSDVDDDTDDTEPAAKKSQ